MGNAAWSELWLKRRKREGVREKWFSRCALEGFDREDPVVKNALGELEAGCAAVAGEALGESEGRCLRIAREAALAPEGFRVVAGEEGVALSAADARGLLYGVFHLLRSIRLGEAPEEACGTYVPDNPLRMLNHWDNMDGTIERGYSGRSFFFKDGKVLTGERLRDYARLIASVGINAVVINNVNVKDDATWLITERYDRELKHLSGVLESWGIRLFLSVNFAAPLTFGLDTCDPLEEPVRRWWKETVDGLYERLPGLGGFLVKADSEGRPGPFTYGRTQAQGANMLAECLAPHGGLLLWRCFVYNCTQDWRDRKTDRARAGYDNFRSLDGEFADNCILQIKNGPMDFQIREPVSPLFGGMEHTRQLLEVQIAQEYTGQQIDLCFLIPMFKEVLEFRTRCRGERDTVKDLVCGITAVANTGDDANWTGSDLAAANLYGFGRLAFSTGLSARQIALEWIGLTFDLSDKNREALADMLLRSREIYEKYTAPLGIGWMVTPATHYGPSVDGYEYDRWGTYHRADHLGLGVDRTAEGTGYCLQYREPNARMYADVRTCPENLLLFFHHLPYTHRLSDGRTLIQYIYDSHFEGYEEAEQLKKTWEEMEGDVESDVFLRVRERFERQLANAREWRDQVNSYFFRKSGIPDEKGREIY